MLDYIITIVVIHLLISWIAFCILGLRDWVNDEIHTTPWYFTRSVLWSWYLEKVVLEFLAECRKVL